MSDPITGKPIDRLDGRLKVTGKAVYAAETPVANVAHAVIVGSTIARGRINAIDTREAERAPGVLAVLTYRNAPKLPGAAKKSESNGRVLQLLQDDQVAYDGQPIAVVVADTLEHARAAAALVGARYAEDKALAELEQAKEAPYTPKPSGPRPPPDSSRGNFSDAFAKAPVKIDATYATQHQTHNAMELHGTVAVWQGSDHLTLYDATQGIFGVKRRAAEIFELKPENIRVISHFLGGGFGSKGGAWSHVMLAAMAARVVSRPVKLVLTRQQMFAFVGYRPRTIQHVQLGAKQDGTLVAVRHEVTSETSRFDEFMEPAAYGTRMLYACPNVQTTHRLVRLDVATPTFTRGPGEASGSFALESAIDELAYALKMDPLTLRLKNYAEKDLEENKPYSSKTLRECYQRAAEKFGWASRKPAPRSMRDGRLLIGYGLATATYPARQMPSSALARVRADGTALVQAGTQDIGTGTYTIMAQLAADALGLPIEKVTFELGDTILPETPLSAGSMTASSTGSAVWRVGLAMRSKLMQLAIADARSPLHGLKEEELEVSEGRIVSKKDRSKGETYADLLSRRGEKQIEERYQSKEKEDRKSFSTHSFGAQMVEVAVDEDLGEVRVRRVVSAFAAGKILNAKTARSQFIGGIVWGIGFALEEHMERDPRTARVVTKDLADYHVPVNSDVPDIDIIMVAEEDAHVNDIGAKGVGEIGIVGVAAAIANAVYHATGKRIRDLPVTLDKLIT